MAGIIITPGTFNPPATPFQNPGIYRFPKTPVQTVQRKWMQLATAGGSSAAPEVPYDDSAMIMPAASVWPASLTVDGAYDVWSAFRRVAMGLQWRGLPPEVTKIRISGVTEISVATGSAELDAGIEFQIADLSTTGSAIDNKVLWTPYMDGQDFYSTGSGLYSTVNYVPGSSDVHIIYPSRHYASILVEWLNSASVIGSFRVFPEYETTTQLRTSATVDTDEDSGRFMLLLWKPGIGYYLRMPSGFTTNPEQTFP